MRQLFGTDGIRGRAGDYPLDRPTVFAVGVALARWIGAHHLDPEVVIGVDTRESGPWIAEHVAAGLEREGVRARFAGLITTPGLAHAAKIGPFAAGVMISASHNPYQDNGIKIIDHSGFKLPDEQEHVLEKHIFACLESSETESGAGLRSAKPLTIDPGLDREYLDFLAATFPDGLAGVRIVVDGANGSATYLGPELLTRLGAQVESIFCSPDGRNINLNCGSQHLEGLRAKVLEAGADLGVAFDGDADRALFVSHSGKIVDGDAVLLLTALPLHARGRLTDVVATVMSNLGLERHLQKLKLSLVRTPVGDRYVLEHMRQYGFNLGGEPSGHIILSDYATTGDGLVAALQVLAVVKKLDKPVSEACHRFEPLPQVLKSVRYRSGKPLENSKVQSVIASAETRLNGHGRLVIRPSGTEPVIRVMGEGDDKAMVEEIVDSIVDALTDQAA
jgi:phosphoglucosamine mutase